MSSGHISRTWLIGMTPLVVMLAMLLQPSPAQSADINSPDLPAVIKKDQDPVAFTADELQVRDNDRIDD